MKNKRLVGVVLTVAILLLIPWIGMQYTAAVQWTLFDFIVAGALMLGTGLLCDLILRKFKETQYRLILCAALLLVLLLVWIELAVGLFGTPLAGS